MASVETLAPPPSLDGDGLRQRELGAFLRSRRERLRPEQVGLPPSRRRRTPGLRREEVAQLAGVGITWYTWLEQGRDIHPSAQVLDAIARTLRFDRHEHSHLFTLAGVTATPVPEECTGILPTAQPLMDQLEPMPAVLLNARFDLLGYNRVWGSFFDGLETMPIEDRNVMWLAFTDPDWATVIVDREAALGRMVAEFRAAMAEHIDEPAWKELVGRLQRTSPEFAALWERHDVQGPESRTKRALHPAAGLLSVDYTNLWLGDRHGTRIVAYSPADELTRVRLERLYESLSGST